MSYSTASACRPEMSRRPTMKSALATPTTTMPPISSASVVPFLSPLSVFTTAPERRATAIAPPCERTASTAETIREPR